MSLQEIPLTSGSQILYCNIGSITYRLSINWRDPYGYYLDLADNNGNYIIRGVPIVTGCDIMAQLKYLNIPGQWVILTDGQQPYLNPSYNALGLTSHFCVNQ